MISKQIEYLQSEEDRELVTLLPEGSNETNSLVKTASYAGEVDRYIKNLEREKGYIYALVNALTAGEYYGPNRNGDYFPEEALKKYHNTFVDHGHVYKHHRNKDPKKAMGKVIFSHYNDEMKRVEVVIKLIGDHPDVISLVESILNGNIPKVSMGCKVPEDYCSITGKCAKTRAEYSDYLKNQMGQVLPDGRRVYAINKRPRFFDLSIVTIPADPVASFMSS